MLRLKSIALAIALMPTIASATTLYVKTTGNDANDCKSWANSCSTLARAKNQVASNVDEIWVASGVYSFSNQVFNDMPGNYALKIYGGFSGTETAVDFRDPVKNVVVFSADVDGVDSNKVGGVTTSHTNVLGTGTTRILAFFNTGVLSTSPINILDGVTMTGMNLKTIWSGGLLIYNAKAIVNDVKFIGNKGHAPAIYFSQPFSSATITNTEFTNNYSLDDVPAADSEIADGGAIYAESPNAILSCDNCKFTGNRAQKTGGAVRVSSGASVNILNSGFTLNVAETAAGGAIFSDSSGSVNLVSNLFDANQALAANGGAIGSTAGMLNIESNTFFGNIAGGTGRFGGAINLGSGTTHAVIKYSTFMNNTANGSGGKGGAINVNAGYPTTKPEISHSLFLNNSSPTGANISDMSSVTDGGYNMIGYAGAENIAGAWTKASTSLTATEPELSRIIEPSLAFNGGQFKSLKLAVNSIAIDAIPTDLPLSSIGTSPSNPFTSIAQARGVMASYSSYDAGKYFFNLSGTTFATYVDKDGYVLVASSDSTNLQAAPYTQVSTLTQRSDSILNSTIMAKLNASEIDEVRISAENEGDRGSFDGFSKDPDVISSLSQFKTLNNPGDGGTWLVTKSSKAVNYFTGLTTPQLSLAAEIYHANGQAGIHWIPSRPDEALLYPGTNQASINDELDLWVRSSKGVCNGTIGTDQRSLPRPDYVNPNDPNQYGLVTDCDIGAFEWNNGYQLDCWNEDGARPENNLSGGTATLCFSDPNSLNPKAFIDNFGYIHWQSLVMLVLLGVFRCRRKESVM
jgi:hypothetical protein